MNKKVFEVGDHVEVHWGEYEGHGGVKDGAQGIVVNASHQSSLELKVPAKSFYTNGGFYLQAHQIRLLKTKGGK